MSKSTNPANDKLNEGGRDNFEKGIRGQISESHIPDFQHTPSSPSTPPPPPTDSAGNSGSGGSTGNDD